MEINNQKGYTRYEIDNKMNPPSYWMRKPDFIFPPETTHKAATVWEHKLNRMRVLRSLARMENDQHWIHISVSRKDRLPTWDEIQRVKEEFIGEEFEAFHIIPKKSDHVNVHKFCIHLFSGNGAKLPNLQKILVESAL